MKPPLRAFCAALLLAAGTAQAQDAPRISVLTFGPGEIYWQRFGHNAVLVRDNGRALVYNYGFFDWSQDNFLLNFARGEMTYFLAVDTLARTLAQYHHEGREVIEQELDLPPEQAQRMAEFLAWNARPENAPYRYDYYLAACSTRIRDVIDDIGDGVLQFMHERPARFSYRAQTVRLTAPDIPLMLALDLLLGPAADRPRSVWEESFVPGVLAEALRDAQRVDDTGNRIPLVRAERLLVPASTERAADLPPAQPPDLRLPFAAAGLLWALLLLAAARWLRPLWALMAGAQLVAAGAGGLVLAFLGLATAHWAGWYNLNLLTWNPLAWLALPAVWAALHGRAPGRLSRTVALLLPLCAALGLAGVLWQDNLHHVLFWLPVHAALVLTVRRRSR